jgi:hypothetical protein
MNPDLVKELRSWNLYPLELDTEMQIFYSSSGIDPSTIETHYTPGTPKRTLERYDKITEIVWELHDLEIRDQENTKFYQIKEDQIRKLLFELTHPTAEDVLDKMLKNGAVTGVVGIYRDPLGY